MDNLNFDSKAHKKYAIVRKDERVSETAVPISNACIKLFLNPFFGITVENTKWRILFFLFPWPLPCSSLLVSPLTEQLCSHLEHNKIGAGDFPAADRGDKSLSRLRFEHCGYPWIRSPDSSSTSECTFQCQRSSEENQYEDLTISLFVLWFHNVLWCGNSLK